MAEDTQTRSRSPRAAKPSDSTLEIFTKAGELRIAVLQAQEVLKGIQAEASEVTGKAREVYESVRDAENDKMAASQAKVDAAAGLLQAYNDEQSKKAGVPNILGALGMAPSSEGPTPQVRL